MFHPMWVHIFCNHAYNSLYVNVNENVLVVS